VARGRLLSAYREDVSAEVVVRFNDRINARDVDGLAELMSGDHRFVDSAGEVVSGKDACLAAWRGFFDAFPGYRNVFESVADADGVVTVIGRSVCPALAALDGPALWRAVVTSGLVAEWRVYDDTPESRRHLGLG
jgi:ketosteroid isomerase-like protein